MKKNVLYLCLLLGGTIALLANCGGEESSTTDVTPEDAGTVAADTHCVTAPASWFSGPTTVAPSDYGPFSDTAITTDCDFHRWSWQKFLSLTRSDNGRAPFEDLVQVDNDLNKMGSQLNLIDSSQAGSTGTLYDKNNRAVHYSIYLNEKMYAFQKKMLPVFKKNLDSLAATGLDTMNYPVGCIEIKASWVLISGIPKGKINDYYISNAKLNGKTVQVALIGMHIVGRVDKHPELVWATFEHEDLAPDYDWNNKDTNQVLSKKDFVFYDANTSANNCPMNNGKTSPVGFTNIFNYYSLGMPESYNNSAVPSSRDLSNNANIVALNKSVKKQLSNDTGPWDMYFYKGSIWLNDPDDSNFQPGDDNIGSLTNTSLRGSRAIGNITMETFVQNQSSKSINSGSMNCFDCHGTSDFKNQVGGKPAAYNLALSHLFMNALSNYGLKKPIKSE
ncbi:MAG: hypothetical protein HYZ43_10130 [Flavobacteriia bacterium]|nr:hypothetical protein [Flavobacteriia bacterium]